MTRKRWTRALVLGDPGLRRNLADAVRSEHPVEAVLPPRVGLILITVRESARCRRFHLGEVLVSEARVRVAGCSGRGLVQGRDLDAAVDLAVIDAALAGQLSLTTEWEGLFLAAEAHLEARLDEEQAVLAQTRVEFETLDTGAAR